MIEPLSLRYRMFTAKCLGVGMFRCLHYKRTDGYQMRTIIGPHHIKTNMVLVCELRLGSA